MMNSEVNALAKKTVAKGKKKAPAKKK